ncbi:MAG: bacillithiol biosynthesis cysteine-adding enzyme BshC [Ferruginibacter sp.]
MDLTASYISYGDTRYFSKIVLDYLAQAPSIQPFYRHPVSLEGIKASITARQGIATDRQLLVDVLQKQYASVPVSESVAKNIGLLQNDNTFTLCTAHQPNIFTGPLYFIYKILHVVKLAGELKEQLKDNDFVPVYYMGSEDADLDELGHIYIDGEKYDWKTNQAGAVGRMKVDRALVDLIDTVSGQLLVHPYGAEIIGLMKECYKENVTIAEATFQLVNRLFGDYGVVILLPDNPRLKNAFIPVIEKELTTEFSYSMVQDTITKFPVEYKVQASGRELNLFYLKDDKRERIEMVKGEWSVVNTNLKFTKEGILAELKEFPGRFSPNVILRPVFQEWILPNVAFIGGGGEIAYWLQLKKVFEAVEVPYPVLMVRNSFLLVSRQIQAAVNKLKFGHGDLFQTEQELINQLVKRESVLQLSLQNEYRELAEFYEKLKLITADIDITLQRHTSALQTRGLKLLAALEKKMLRAEKRKFEVEQRKLEKIKRQLFPLNNLQERVDNLMPYYAVHGKGFIEMIYNHSKGLEQKFGVLIENEMSPVTQA